MSKAWTELSDEEFGEILDHLSQPDYDNLTAEEFFGALAAMEADRQARSLEITGQWREGRVIFDETAPLPVQGNRIQVGGTTLIINLRPAA